MDLLIAMGVYKPKGNGFFGRSKVNEFKNLRSSKFRRAFSSFEQFRRQQRSDSLRNDNVAMYSEADEAASRLDLFSYTVAATRMVEHTVYSDMSFVMENGNSFFNYYECESESDNVGLLRCSTSTNIASNRGLRSSEQLLSIRTFNKGISWRRRKEGNRLTAVGLFNDKGGKSNPSTTTSNMNRSIQCVKQAFSKLASRIQSSRALRYYDKTMDDDDNNDDDDNERESEDVVKEVFPWYHGDIRNDTSIEEAAAQFAPDKCGVGCKTL